VTASQAEGRRFDGLGHDEIAKIEADIGVLKYFVAKNLYSVPALILSLMRRALFHFDLTISARLGRENRQAI